MSKTELKTNRGVLILTWVMEERKSRFELTLNLTYQGRTIYCAETRVSS